MRLITVLSFICLLCAAGAADVGQAPVRPGALLKCLPPADPNWILTQSKAAHIRRNPPLSKARRVLTGAIIPAGALAAPVVNISVIDTCGEADLLNEYLEQQDTEGAENSSGLIKINGMPAKIVRTPGRPDAINVLALQRFILTFELPAGQKVEEWIAKVDLDGLEQAAKASGASDRERNYQFTFEWVDELNPKGNREVKAEIAGSAAVE